MGAHRSRGQVRGSGVLDDQGGATMVISVLVRRLRSGKTYDDFREAWKPDKGFGVPTRVVTAQGIEDPQEIITIGFMDLDPDEAAALLGKVGDQEAVRHDRIDDVIEPGMTRAFYVQVADDDLTDGPPPG
jgi:hypothetical protein